MNAKAMYRCSECAELHEFEDDAEECCRPTVESVFVCGECDSMHLSQGEAIFCCSEGSDELSADAYRERLKQLESHGQTRLLP